jgi:hypothetical protein
MEQDLSGAYEVVLPITLDGAQGPVAAGNTVDLDHEDAALFLARGFVRKPGNPLPPATASTLSETPGVATAGVPATTDAPQPGLDRLDAATRAVLASAGFDAAEKVLAASDQDLLAIDGIGPGRLKQIRADVAGA